MAYVGEVPFPTPGTTGYELRENVPFVARLTVLRRACAKRGGMAADEEGRCFRLFWREFCRLEASFGRLRIGCKITGKWVMVRKGPAFGVHLLAYRDYRGNFTALPRRGGKTLISAFRLAPGDGGERSL